MTFKHLTQWGIAGGAFCVVFGVLSVAWGTWSTSLGSPTGWFPVVTGMFCGIVGGWLLGMTLAERQAMKRSGEWDVRNSPR